MDKAKIEELEALMELSTRLSLNDILKIRNIIAFPEGLLEEVTGVPQFLIALRSWKGHNPIKFYNALCNIRPDLISIACKVPWLCVSSPEEEELSVKSLIELLRSEITKGQCILIYNVVANEPADNMDLN